MKQQNGAVVAAITCSNLLLCDCKFTYYRVLAGGRLTLDASVAVESVLQSAANSYDLDRSCRDLIVCIHSFRSKKTSV